MVSPTFWPRCISGCWMPIHGTIPLAYSSEPMVLQIKSPCMGHHEDMGHAYMHRCPMQRPHFLPRMNWLGGPFWSFLLICIATFCLSCPAIMSSGIVEWCQVGGLRGVCLHPLSGIGAWRPWSYVGAMTPPYWPNLVVSWN